MKTQSEGTTSAQRISRVVMPTKTLLQGKRYTDSRHTDVARTIAVHQRLIRMQGARNAQS